MSDTVIRVENLSKKYIIGHQQQERHNTLRDVIANGAKGLINSWQNGKGKSQNNQEEFWALKDVSFEIKQGDRVGIIGRNGAGKSTLLKILSRITEPTKGSINIKGRIASLLEVGTGFHPELTGRENIYLNGAILGMSKEEIKRKFDEIVAFAEVEKFLDTPVKRYSSGMYVRLAFAVAAHLEPEILIVDEVLAVGDMAFQKKCLGKMEEVGKEGRTVIFVSHSIHTLEAICSKAFLLDRGNLIQNGKVNNVTAFYAKMLNGGNTNEIYHVVSDKLIWKGIANRKSLENLSHKDNLSFLLAFESGNNEISNFYVDCALYNDIGQSVIHLKSKFVSDSFSIENNKTFYIQYNIERPNLSPGGYHMTLFIYTYPENEVIFWAEKIDACDVIAKSYFNKSEILDGLNSATIPNFSVLLSDKLTSTTK